MEIQTPPRRRTLVSLSLSVSLLSLPQLASAAEPEAKAQVAAAPAPAGASEAEVAKLRAELEELKAAAAATDATVKAIDERTADAPSHSDLEALRDIEEEHILRSVGSSSAISPYPVNGGLQHLVNLTGSAGLLYSATPGGPTGTSTRGLRINLISLAISGKLREDTGRDGDIRYNVGFLATQNRYNAAANTTQSGATASASSVNGATLNGTYVNASDVWFAYDVKTTKLQLEPLATLSIQAGQYLVPFGIEATSNENNRPTINQAQFYSRLGFGRDLGVIFTGGLLCRNDPSATTVPLFNYTLGVFNGSGQNSFDNNTAVDLLGRLVLNPFYQYADNFRNLSIGGTWYEGNKFATTGKVPVRRRIGADFSWLRKPFLLTAEYIYAKDGYEDYRNAPTKGTGGGSISPAARARTFVGTLFFTPGTLPDFQPWIRADLWRATPYSNLTDAQIVTANNAGNWGNRRDAYSVGFNWFIWAVEPIVRRSYATAETWRVLKLQASYTRLRQEAFHGAKNQIDVYLLGSF
jgi:hypothetical protein